MGVGIEILALDGFAQAVETKPRYAAALSEIHLTADSIGESVTLDRPAERAALSDETNARLSSLTWMLTDMEIDGAVAYARHGCSDLLQSDPARGIASRSNCGPWAFNKLADALLGRKTYAIQISDEYESPKTAQEEDASQSKQNLLERIQGNWYSPDFDYGFDIEGDIGIATLSNAPGVYNAGDPMLRISEVREDAISGEQIFTNGHWYRVRISVLDENTIELDGRGFIWKMIRPRRAPKW
ncbi:MAG: hypothetical protein KDA73_15630 [Rhodobacteraceae bacterium]|nr:hypothetical protein [Paracoccaceae bacterium]